MMLSIMEEVCVVKGVAEKCAKALVEGVGKCGRMGGGSVKWLTSLGSKHELQGEEHLRELWRG